MRCADTISGTRSREIHSLRTLEVGIQVPWLCMLAPAPAVSHTTTYADVPLHDEEGNCFWLDEAGQRLDQDPNVSPLPDLHIML